MKFYKSKQELNNHKGWKIIIPINYYYISYEIVNLSILLASYDKEFKIDSFYISSNCLISNDSNEGYNSLLYITVPDDSEKEIDDILENHLFPLKLSEKI